jgi:hypothetical protein
LEPAHREIARFFIEAGPLVPILRGHGNVFPLRAAFYQDHSEPQFRICQEALRLRQNIESLNGLDDF